MKPGQMSIAQLQLQLEELRQQAGEIHNALREHGMVTHRRPFETVVFALDVISERIEKFIDEESRRGEPPTQG